ncbi:MAG TPA: YfhO family protein, partial [bacterium]|nr:YfhO family protein [bacterium]
PRQVVILSEPPRETFTMRPRDDPGQILRRSYGLSRLTFDLALNGPAVFVLSDTYYPGWRAYIDGREAPVYRANHAFRAVVLPAETRRLEFVFQPRSVQIGGGISILGWGILAAVVLVRGRQRP